MTNENETSNQQSESKELQKKVKGLKQKLDECLQEKEGYLSGWKRARADFSNYKKDEQKRLEQAQQRAKKDLIEKVLPVLDSFKRARQSVEADQISEGILNIEQEFLSILEKEGLEKIQALNKEFDPKLHEALDQVPADEQQGTIVEVVTSGYKYRGEVLRAAEVKVAAGKNKN